MKIAIHQPDYIPYIGLFYKMWESDVFVYLDDAQFSSSNMHNWNRIKTPQGEYKLKIPVQYNFGDNINYVFTKDNLNWKDKHLKIIKMNYARAKYYKDFYYVYKELLLSSYSNLADMNITINSHIANLFGINPRFYKASEFKINSLREKRIIDICVQLGGDTYISGKGAKVYQNEKNFNNNGINLKYTNYKNIKYKQQWGKFVNNTSIIDYIFNCGFDWGKIEKNMIN